MRTRNDDAATTTPTIREISPRDVSAVSAAIMRSAVCDRS